jgi:hypothetical protein
MVGQSSIEWRARVEGLAHAFERLAGLAGRPELSHAGDLSFAIERSPDHLDRLVDELEAVAAHAIAETRLVLDSGRPQWIAAEQARLRERLAKLDEELAAIEEQPSRDRGVLDDRDDLRAARAAGRAERDGLVTAAEDAIGLLAAHDRTAP